MKRREFITLLGGAAAWPLAARAQQGERMRQVGIIIGPTGEESETKARIDALLQELKHLGWAEGRNVRIEIRASAGNISVARKYVAELVQFELLAANSWPSTSMHRKRSGTSECASATY
jgi:putative ABC transport system substrate-binding protein